MEFYNPGDLDNNSSMSPKSNFLVFLMVYLCQFGKNLAIGSDDRMQTRLFQSVL